MAASCNFILRFAIFVGKRELEQKKNSVHQHSVLLRTGLQQIYLRTKAVYSHWTGLVDWTSGLDWWTGMVD